MSTRHKNLGPKRSPKKTSPDQLTFDFQTPVVIEGKLPRRRPAIKGEVLLPATQARLSPEPSLSQEEHRYFRQQSDKYERYAVRATLFFLVLAVITVMAKSGIPITEAILKQYKLPHLDNSRLLSGILGLFTLAALMTLIWSAARYREVTPQRSLALSDRRLAMLVTRAILIAWLVIVSSVAIAIFYLTAGDILHTVTHLYMHTHYVMRGWEPALN